MSWDSFKDSSVDGERKVRLVTEIEVNREFFFKKRSEM